MPVAALLSAVARVAAVTGSVAARAGAATFRAGAAAARSAAAGARALGRATVRFAQAVGRVIRQTGASIAKATRKVLSVIRRGILQFVQYVQNRIKAIESGARRLYQTYKDKILKDIAENILDGFNDATVKSNSDFENALADAIEDPPDSKARRNLKIDTLRNRFIQRFTDVVRDLAGRESISDEEALEIFRSDIAPELAAARVIMTEDPTALLDEDATYQLAVVAENFLEMVRELSTTADEIDLVNYLVSEGVMAAKAAAFRQTLLAQAVRDRVAVNVDAAIMASVSKFANPHVKALGEEELMFIDTVVESVLGERVIYSTPSRITRLAHSLSGVSFTLSKLALQVLNDVIGAAMRRQHISTHKYFKILKEGIERLGDEPQARLNLPDSTDTGLESDQGDVVEDEPTTGEETAKESKEPFEDAEEDDVMYGIWETNATRTVQENCPDCTALEALTSMYPVPVAELPTPGVETLCGQKCACAIRVVNADEFDAVRGQWSTVWERFTGETLPRRFEKEDTVKVKSLVNVMMRNADRFMEWAKKLHVSDIEGED